MDFSILDNQSVLITGGTGSFGQKFVRDVLDNAKPKKLIIFSRDELKQFEMEQDLREHKNFGVLRFFLGDVRDAERLNMAFREVDYIVHAAALKQVVAAEYNPFEFIKTNVMGAQNIVTAALNNKAKALVALSTDKAANPINLYGTSKLASDKIFTAANHLSGNIGTKFSVVRYGNVVGSRGSVVPFFKKLISNGAKELPITDERMTRFWITLDQGVSFVISCLNTMHGGEVFVPKIPSVRITDLARAIAPGLPHKIIGVRPGEKIHEVMVTSDDAPNTLELQDRYVILPSFVQNDLKARYVYKNMLSNVPSGFSYASDTNTVWLSERDLQDMISDCSS